MPSTNNQLDARETDALAVADKFFSAQPRSEDEMKAHILRYAPHVSVLHVDDDKNIQQQVHSMLNAFPFKRVSAANNGAEGLSLYATGQFNVVITDFEMPIMNGFEMIEKILEINPKQVIIALSSYEQHDFLKRTFRNERICTMGSEKGLVQSARYTNKNQFSAEFLRILTRACGFVAMDYALDSTQASIRSSGLYDKLTRSS